jgi:hypothetical protein
VKHIMNVALLDVMEHIANTNID